MNDEARRATRRKVSDTVPVADAMTGQAIGHIGNISETGMLLFASAPLREDALYQIGFALPDAGGKRHAFEFGAHVLWLADAGAQRHAWCGLRFIAIPREQLAQLRAWIQAPGGTVA